MAIENPDKDQARATAVPDNDGAAFLPDEDGKAIDLPLEPGDANSQPGA